jgi:hypothetical protein
LKQKNRDTRNQETELIDSRCIEEWWPLVVLKN